jgi:hypothetical protein
VEDPGVFSRLIRGPQRHLRMRWLPCVFGALPISTAVINRNCFPYDTHGRLQTLNSA